MADGSSVSDMIGSVPLFSGLDSKGRKAFAQGGKERSYKEGEVVVSQGATGVGFFLVMEGAVEVRKGRQVLATLSRGDFFGEMSLLDNQPRTADVVAVKPTGALCSRPGASLRSSRPTSGWRWPCLRSW